MRRPLRIALIILLFPPTLAAVGGWLAGPSFLHPIRRELTPALIRDADVTFAEIHAQREEFDVRAADGVLLRGWKVRAANSQSVPSGSTWVLLFHGVADNRIGVLERKDTTAIVDALEASEHPRHLFVLGESMGAGIALQSAAVEPRIEAVVAEASFANLQEAAYDYAGLRRYPWLGKTWFAPGTWTMLYLGESLAGFPAAEVSPEKAVASHAFPVFLICDAEDVVLPCRHSKRIYDAAIGPKQMWIVPRAFHTAALGYEPVEFRRRVLDFFAQYGGT
jgi:alpha-beta hydrolase superfamily lysophospholipase